MKNTRNRRGFTMVELCVVLAVVSIIIAMLVTFMIFISNQREETAREARCIAEISSLQSTVDSWLKQYDSEVYTISSSGTGLIAVNMTSQPVGTISFNSTDKTVQFGDTAQTEVLENIKSAYFTVLEGKNAVRVRITYGKKNTTQDLIFPLFSHVTRSRRVENRS